MAKRAWRYWEPTFLADQVCEMNPVWPWGGHRRFAYDLVRWMRPARIGELGVHWGTSFFTFAQAIKDGRMKDAELIGVDTFEGEDHAGHYGPEVYDTVRRIVREHFAKQSITLHRMYFRDALAHVEDGTLDLLHIDGLHTFEAVKDDFETWLPKLAPEGVMLFHDVAPDTGYGSTDFWNQLVGLHPGFAFEHSWGLGVLFPRGDARLAQLRAEGLDDKLIAYPALARAERAGHEVRDLGRMAKDRFETIQKQGELNAELRQQLAELRASTVASAAHERIVTRAEAAERLARERYEVMQKQSQVIGQRDERIGGLGKQLEAAQHLAVERLEALRQGGLRAASAEAARDELRERVGDLRDRVKAQDDRLAELSAAQQTAAERNSELRENNATLREKLAAKHEATERLREQVEAARAANAALDDRLGDMATHVAALVGSHARSREESAEKLAGLAAAVEQARRAGEAAAATLAQRLTRLDTDADLLSMRAEHLEDVVGQHRAKLRDPDDDRAAGADWLTGEKAKPAAPPTRRPRNS